jgi:general secretion pathway protein I
MTRQRAEPGHRPAVRASGFTLIEVLAALVIVALGMLGVIEAVTQEAKNGAYLREKTLAHWIAMNVVTERRLQAAPPPVAESSDDVEFAGRRWHWTMRVSQTQVQSLRRMDVSVRPADSPDGVELATVSGFYGTAIGPAGEGALAWSGTPVDAPSDQDEEERSRPRKNRKPPQPPTQGMPPANPPAEED